MRVEPVPEEDCILSLVGREMRRISRYSSVTFCRFHRLDLRDSELTRGEEPKANSVFSYLKFSLFSFLLLSISYASPFLLNSDGVTVNLLNIFILHVTQCRAQGYHIVIIHKLQVTMESARGRHDTHNK